MSTAMVFDHFWGALHKRVGRCGHCGKRECSGREGWSQVPDRVSLEDVIQAVKEATEELSRVAASVERVQP